MPHTKVAVSGAGVVPPDAGATATFTAVVGEDTGTFFCWSRSRNSSRSVPTVIVLLATTGTTPARLPEPITRTDPLGDAPAFELQPTSTRARTVDART